MKNQNHFYLHTTLYASFLPLINVRPFENTIISFSQKKKLFMAGFVGLLLCWVLSCESIRGYSRDLGMPTRTIKLSKKWE